MKKSVGLLLLLAVVLATAGSAAAINPNDANWSLSWPQARVKMPLAWNLSTGSRHVTVAVVDTGIDPALKDLKGRMVPGRDFISGGYTKVDLDGHGTLSATIIAARGNNGVGIAGYCWSCRVMPVRVSSDGQTFDGGLVAAGITWAADHGARIISLGFSDEGQSASDPRVAAAIAYAAQKGVLVIASAGNSGSSGYTHPAAYPGAYAVAATNRFDQLFPWSTRGAWIHLAAPGCQLALPRGSGAIRPCGSSVAAPAVAGIAALMLSINPTLTPAQIVSVLEQTSRPVAGIDGGRVDAYAALLAVGGHASLSPGAKPVHLRRDLRKHWRLKLTVQGRRLAATLRSPKARSCSLSLASSDSIWLSSKQGQRADSLDARVSTGQYRLDISCKLRRPRPASLTVRTFSN
jgi:subtilisin family serine protease